MKTTYQSRWKKDKLTHSREVQKRNSKYYWLGVGWSVVTILIVVMCLLFIKAIG